MIDLPPTQLLTLCLLAATLLGGGIGACLWHLRSAGRFERALENVRRASASERAALGAVITGERESATTKHAEARQVAVRSREQAERLRVRHDTLAVHAREQGRRIDALEAEILAYEELYLEPRRDPASDRAEWRPAERSPAGSRPGPGAVRRDAGHRGAGHRGAGYRDTGRTDDDLPILNRRVGSRPAPGKGLSSGGNLDIPTLIESKLPTQADELALESLDARDPFPDHDD